MAPTQPVPVRSSQPPDSRYPVHPWAGMTETAISGSLDLCGVVFPLNTSRALFNVSCADGCNVPNGDNSSCSDACGVLYGTDACVDACGLAFGDNATCTDACAVVNGNNATCR